MAKQIAPHSPAVRPPSREGMRVFTTYVPPEVLKQIRQLVLDTENPGQDLGREALNLLFKKYKLDPIA